VEILSVDFTAQEFRPTTFVEAVEFFANGSPHESDNSVRAVLRPWMFVVVDSSSGLTKNLNFYKTFLESVNVPRLILIVDFTSQEDLGTFEIPDLFEQHQQRVRIIAISSSSGCLWDVRSVQPDGVCPSGNGSTNSANLSALCDAFKVPEVFEAVFQATADQGVGVWSVGTRQSWFGSIEHTALADAFRDVGTELLGDDARVAILRRLPPWIDDVSQELLGDEFEDDIFDQGGRASNWFSEASSATSSAEAAFGLRSIRRGMVDRVATFPDRQVAALDRLADSLAKCDEEIRSLLLEVDASDGFQKGEIAQLRAVGIQLNRQDDSRIDRYHSSEFKILDSALEHMDRALEKGYSLSTVRAELEQLLRVVAPRTRDEIFEGKASQGGSYERADDLIGYDAVSLRSLSEALRKAARGVPKNPIAHLGRWSAKVLRSSTTRVVGSLLYLWLALVFLFETLGLAKGVPSLVPTPAAARDSGRVLMTGVFIGLSIVVVVMGICLIYCSRRIQRWGRSSGIPAVHRSASSAERFFKKIVLNEWVLWAFRDSGARFLGALNRSVENLGTVIREVFVDSEIVATDDPDTDRPNPQIRQFGGELAAAAWFRQMDEIKGMLKSEVISLIRHRYRIGTPEFRTQRSEQIAESLANEIKEPLEQYVARLQRDGVLQVSEEMNAGEREIREKLAMRYWGDFHELRSSLSTVLDLDPYDSMVQFIRPEDITRVDQGDSRALVVRFAPEPSRRLIGDLRRVHADVVFTESTQLAGALRFVPYRSDQLRYFAVGG
jgi:hypothetical protein